MTGRQPASRTISFTTTDRKVSAFVVALLFGGSLVACTSRGEPSGVAADRSTRGAGLTADDVGRADEPTPSASQPQREPDVGNQQLILSGTWPQATRQEVADAQRQADAGDPDVLWQTRLNPADGGPGNTGAEIAERFLEQELGWTEFRLVGGVGRAFGRPHPTVWHVAFARCEEGAVNPLYPSDEMGGLCAPTISDTRYETVKFRLERPVTDGPGGIWVIASAIRMGPNGEFEQSVPPTSAELQDAVRAFLDARVAGTGAEEFLYLDPGHEQEDLETIPMLYETIGGLPYERADLVSIDYGPSWPSAWFGVTVRLFPEGSDLVVTESIVVRPEDEIRPEGGKLIVDYR